MEPMDKQKAIEPEDFLDFLDRLAQSTAELFGSNCETLICRPDLPEHNIVRIYNGNVTGRQVGDKQSAMGMKLAAAGDFTDQRNYAGKTGDGRIIKSFSLYVTIDGVPYSYGINFDCTELLKAMPMLHEIVSIPQQIEDEYGVTSQRPPMGLLEELLQACGKPPLLLNTAERRQIISQLHQQEYFNLHGAVKEVAARLHISPHTVYKYLRQLKAEA